MDNISIWKECYQNNQVSTQANTAKNRGDFSLYLVEPAFSQADLTIQARNSEEIQPVDTASEPPEGKHLAQRPVKEWGIYGDYGKDIWSREFERVVLHAKKRIEKKQWHTASLIRYVESERKVIALKRMTCGFRDFGVRRNRPADDEKNYLSYTSLYSSRYFHGMHRAVSLAYDGQHYIRAEDMGTLGALFRQRFHGSLSQLRYGQVIGHIGGKNIPLTLYVFCPRIKAHRQFQSEQWFGNEDDYYVGPDKEAALWLHTDRHLIAQVMDHIKQLVDRALQGDLSVIPRIHWWYVHLAPLYRGSGGAAEMLTNTLCRLQGIDLPAWAEGIAPSVEILLEPDEEKFCQNYHLLFDADQAHLQQIFSHNAPVST